jgi:hypothetical protein
VDVRLIGEIDTFDGSCCGPVSVRERSETMVTIHVLLAVGLGILALAMVFLVGCFAMDDCSTTRMLLEAERDNAQWRSGRR